jgi:YVTN family beta-propeller protein
MSIFHRKLAMFTFISKPLQLLIGANLALQAAGCSDEGSADDWSTDEVELGVGPSRATNSSAPLALSRDEATLFVVSTDTDRLTAIDTRTHALLARVSVGRQPQSVALDPEGRFVYVANSGSNDLSVLDARRLLRRGERGDPDERRITTGAGPQSVVVSADGRSVFVANSGQDTITVLSNRDQRVEQVLNLRDSACNLDDANRHFQPRGLAVSEDGRQLYVTRFLSQTRFGGTQRGDYGKEGMLCRVDRDGRVPRFTAIRLAPSETGFLDRNGRMTGAFPNQLQSVVLRDGHAYLPNIAASPAAPLGFDVDTQAYVNRVDDAARSARDAGALNLHLGARDPEPGRPELYFANPRAIAFSTPSGKGSAYVVSAASDVLVKLDVDERGVLSFTRDSNTTRYIDLDDPDAPETSGANAGKNPVGIVIDRHGSRAYVLNRVSRNVSIVSLARDRVEHVVAIDDLPAPGSREEVLLVGEELFFSSRGNFVPRGADTPGSVRGRLSEKGHQACSSCHADGLTDGVVWQFASGPRKTIPINGTVNPRRPSEQRIINASAIFDELEDVDFNTRRVSSGEPLAAPRPCFDDTGSGLLQATNDPNHGLIIGNPHDLSLAPCVLVPFAVPNENRPQLDVQLPGSTVLVGATDALKEWQRRAVPTPNRPLTNLELVLSGLDGFGPDAQALVRGRNLFEAAGCPLCHGGAQWTTKIKDFVSPPDPAEIATESAAGANPSQYLHRFLTEVGTFELNVAGGANLLPGFPAIGGVEKDANERNALGFDYDGDGKGNGYNTPSLLGGFASPPYFHNGACESYDCVLANVAHRRAGLSKGDRDPLVGAGERRALATYLEAIDLRTRPHRVGAADDETEE